MAYIKPSFPWMPFYVGLISKVIDSHLQENPSKQNINGVCMYNVHTYILTYIHPYIQPSVCKQKLLHGLCFSQAYVKCSYRSIVSQLSSNEVKQGGWIHMGCSQSECLFVPKEALSWDLYRSPLNQEIMAPPIIQLLNSKFTKILMEKCKEGILPRKAKEKWRMTRMTLKATSHYPRGCIMGQESSWS